MYVNFNNDNLYLYIIIIIFFFSVGTDVINPKRVEVFEESDNSDTINFI